MSVESEVRPAPPKKKRRGRETVFDMVRSLGLIMLIVVPVYLLAQPPGSDSKAIRVVDPTADLASFAAAAPGVPVPTPPPAGWRATVTDLQPGSLRVGWVVPGDAYAEYAASTAAAADVVPGATGDAREVGTFVVDGVTWQQYRDGDGHTSLVREVAGGTVVVGGLRETATLDELRALAGSVR